MKRIPSLDGWRGIAILLVLLDHLTEGAQLGRFSHFFRLGSTGVGLFFALSGFLITTRLLEERERNGRIDLGRFYMRRAFRLLPASATYLVVIGILAAAGVIATTRTEWLASLLFFRNYLPMAWESGGWWTAHFWSLAIEEHFYLAWPALLILTRGRVEAPASLAVGVALWRTLDFHYRFADPGYVLWFPGRSDVRLDALLWGCALGILLMQPAFQEKMRRFYSMGLWFACAGLYVAANLFTGHHNYSPPYESILLTLVIVWPVIHSASWPAKLLDLAWLRWIGRLSYSLYIWQQLWTIFPGSPAPLGRWQHFPGNVLCIFLTAALSYYAIEKPLIDFSHRSTKRKPAQSVRPVTLEAKTA